MWSEFFDSQPPTLIFLATALRMETNTIFKRLWAHMPDTYGNLHGNIYQSSNHNKYITHNKSTVMHYQLNYCSIHGLIQYHRLLQMSFKIDLWIWCH